MDPSTEGNRQDSGTSRLDAWLTRATHGLCPQARERVRREITAHHAEAVEHLRDTGLSPDTADAQALEGLGDAATANKALRSTYLTRWQQRLLAGLSQPAKPLTAKDYSSVVFNASLSPLFAIVAVCFIYHSDPVARWCGGLIVASYVFCWIGHMRIIHHAFNFHRYLKNRPFLAERPTAMNRVYPWLLIAGFLCLYAAWRCYYWNTVPSPFAIDYFLVLAGEALYWRLHKGIGMVCFAASSHDSGIRTGLTASYIAFLVLAFAACLSWSLANLSSFWSSLSESSSISVSNDSVAALFYGCMGCLLAAMFSLVAIRWMIGLYLLRKDANGDGMTEPGPAPCPETPLGE